MQRFALVSALLMIVLLARMTSAAQTTTTSFVFTAAGDHGVGTRSDLSIDAVRDSGSSFYLALGDLSYIAGGEQNWCNNFKARFNDVELIAGNHDTGESAGGNIDNYVRYCPFTLGALTGDYGKQYYFDYPAHAPLARFIMIAPGVRGSLNINYNVGGAGYNFTRDAIATARSSGIKWIVVGMHKNCISIGAKSCEVGTDIMRLLLDNKVDLILQSHDHNYQRSHQLSCITVNSYTPACVTDDGTDGVYAKGGGSVILINGEFGRPLYSINASDSESGYFARSDATTWGVTKYTVSDSELSGQYLRSDGVGFADSFTIRDAGPIATPTGSAHIGDLDRSSSAAGRGWKATVAMTVHTGEHAPVANATVRGTWSGGITGSQSCTTDSEGRCSVTSDTIGKKSPSATWRVDAIAHSTLGYEPLQNHDPDGESTGTSIVVNKP